MAICPVVLAANLLDHRYGGGNLSPLEVGEAMSYIGEIDKSYLPHVSTFIARHELFKESLFDETYKKLSPATWWKSGLKFGFEENFADFSSALVESITSSAGLERQFSIIGMHYGKLRSNLDAQKAGKIAFLYRQLNSAWMNCLLHFVMLMFYVSLKNKHKIQKTFFFDKKHV